MTGFDYVVLGVIAFSAVIGIWRGFVREVLALAAWIAATMVAILFSGQAAGVLPAGFGTPLIRALIAFAVLFLAVLIGTSLAGLLIAKLVRVAGLGVTDRTLGGVFGIARGALIILALVLVAGLTALPKEQFWREAKLSRPLETAALAVKQYLPRQVADRVQYEK
jgi:membrane protein required for colicin V production